MIAHTHSYVHAYYTPIIITVTFNVGIICFLLVHIPIAMNQIGALKLIIVYVVYNNHVSIITPVIAPSEVVSTRNGNATFTCFPIFDVTNVDGIQWLVNGVLLDELELTNVEAYFTILASTRVGTLTFSSISPDQNMTSIRCRAMLHSGGLSALIYSDNSTLVLQGKVVCAVCAMCMHELVYDAWS